MKKNDNWVVLKEKLIVFFEETHKSHFNYKIKLDYLSSISDEESLLDFLIVNIFFFLSDTQPYTVQVKEILDGHYKNDYGEFNIVNGKLNGNFLRFNTKNKEQFVIANKPFVDGFIHGKVVTYDGQTGKLRSEVHYVKGKLHGKYIVYDFYDNQFNDVRYYYKGLQVNEEYMFKINQDIDELKKYIENNLNIQIEKDEKLKEIFDKLSF
jgi:hypothetical protein